MKIVRLVVLLLISGAASASHAQNPSPSLRSGSNTEVGSNQPGSEAAGASDAPPPSVSAGGMYLSSREFIITVVASGVGLVTLVMEFLMLRRLPTLRAEDILRVFAVTLILAGTLFFIAAGFDSNQIAPAMGLFGTVAGYLLGRSTGKKEDKVSD